MTITETMIRHADCDGETYAIKYNMLNSKGSFSTIYKMIQIAMKCILNISSNNIKKTN